MNERTTETPPPPAFLGEGAGGRGPADRDAGGRGPTRAINDAIPAANAEMTLSEIEAVDAWAIAAGIKWTPDQRLAATCLNRDVLVTAGAGSGKTSTLVARYLWLVHKDFAPRRILAITFTDKAALEMRSRVRAKVAGQARGQQDPVLHARWAAAEAQIEAARIGTIHGLCAEILRAHPAEAAIDPGFEVADEARARLLKAEAVEDALAWAAASAEVAPLFDRFSTFALRRVLAYLLDRRLEARTAIDGVRADDPASSDTAKPSIVADTLRAAVSTGPLADGIAELRALRAAGRLLDDAGDKLADQIDGLLSTWDRLDAARAAGDSVAAAVQLFVARREHMKRGAGKHTSRAKACLAEIQAAYDAQVDPWLGGKASTDNPPDPEAEALFAADQSRLIDLFRQAESTYRAALATRRALDFDDLESGAAKLLEMPEVRARWQAAAGAILVDEFQDTNARQVEIVEALCGPALGGRLFVVGDARQSIYRFRGADVAAFQRMDAAFRSRGAEAVLLDLSFRSHAALLRVLDAVLSRCTDPPGPSGPSGEHPTPDIQRSTDPSAAAPTPGIMLIANRTEPRPGVQSPFVELVLGAGADADAGRRVAAFALADRLLALREAGEIDRWEDVALLFRASSGFAAYEAAFEDRAIPFVTVAGVGFYERPEIRDILNILRALAEPWNDLALAGLLRSPAFGLTDAALVGLRWDADRRGKRRLRAALADPAALEQLAPADRTRALRAGAVIAEISPLVDRLPVAELLKAVVDRLDYRAVLATGGSRLWRNLNKLLADARASRLVRVRAFLDYVRALSDVGAREGEAATESAGAVQLMTIHKAKGLEFPFVVIADAAHAHRAGGASVYLDPAIGPAAKPDRRDSAPLAWRLSEWRDQAASDAETGRLLYVAATRAREKLLVSGHITGDGDKPWSARGWLKAIVDATGADLAAACAAPDALHTWSLAHGGEVGLLAQTAAAEGQGEPLTTPAAEWPESTEERLWSHEPVVAIAHAVPVPPIEPPTDFAPPTNEPDTHPGEAALPADLPEPRSDEAPTARLRRITGRHHAPGEAVGTLVHRAIERWWFPGDPRLDRLWKAETARLGLVDPTQCDEALARANELLARLQADPLWAEIEAADERRHELPYVSRVRSDDRIDSGRIDLLYRRGTEWTIIDFKTDSVADEHALKRLLVGSDDGDGARDGEGDPDRSGQKSTGKSGHLAQVRRYAAAIGVLAGITPTVKLCFLDYQGDVRAVEVDPSGE
jgi:ATP-dependent helicase/nuclease subunit A